MTINTQNYTNNMKKTLLGFTAFLMLSALPLVAQEQTEGKPTATEQGWFVGAQGGVPFGVSTFSSFGADKTRMGWSAGLYGGYRFNEVLSLEATANMGEIYLSSKECCIDHNLWLGADGVRYNAPVLDMNGWGYDNLKSNVFMQHYGLRLNVNVLGFFNRTKHSRWTLEVSPLLAAVGTKSTIKTIDKSAEVSKGDTRWHLGAGGNLQAGYQLTRHLNIGVYSGITYLTGDRMDGVPEFRHEANFVWESGIKVGIKFGKGKKRTAPVESVAPAVIEKADKVEEKESVKETPTADDSSKTIEPSETLTATTADVTSTSLPTIHFAFNSTSVAESELAKLQEIKKHLDANPDMKITVNGWCDTKGSKAVNDRISHKRAEAVKRWLTKNGIAVDRITVKGNGSDFNETDASKARRAESVTIITE